MSEIKAIDNDIEYKNISVLREGCGYPIILIHGLNSSHQVWDQVCLNLKPNFSLSRIKIRGFDDVKLQAKPSLKGVRDDLIRYIQEFKLEQPIVIGHSLGGFMALWLASKWKELGPLLILDALPFMGGALNPLLTSLTTSIFAQYVKSKILSAQEQGQWRNWQYHFLKDMVTSESHLKQVLTWSYKADKLMSAEALESLLSIDLRNKIRMIEQDVLILGSWRGYQAYGYRQIDIKRIFERQYKRLTNKKLVFSEHAKHYLMLDDFDWTMAQINGFLDDCHQNAPLKHQADFRVDSGGEKNFLASR